MHRFKNSLYCAACAYLAIISYVKGQYKLTIDHCRLVTQHPVPPTSRQYIMAADLLPHIADIDNSLGFIALCRFVLLQYGNSTSDRKQFLANLARHDAILTPTLFLYYLEIKCLSIGQTYTLPETLQSLDKYLKNFIIFLNCSAFHICLIKQCQTTVQRMFTPSSNATNNRDDSRQCSSEIYFQYNNKRQLADLLIESAVENLTACHQTLATDFNFGKLQTIINVCTYSTVAGMIWRSNYLGRLYVSARHSDINLLVLPEFLQLMDSDIVSIVGLAVLFHR